MKSHIKTFPNGFESWHETHYEVVAAITTELINDNLDNLISKTIHEKGHGGLYELANDLTNEFESLYEGREWDGDFFETIENFLDEKLR